MNLEEFRTKLFGMSGLATVEKTFELYSELEKENERLKAELKSMRYNLDDWHNKADTMEASVKELEAELKQTEAQDQVVIDGLREENERLEREVNRLEATEELLADEQVKILDERDELRKENAKLKGKVGMHDRENERLKKFVSKLQGKIDRQGSMLYYLERTNGFKHETIRNQYKFNRKLCCLTLHLMSEYCFAQGTIIHTKLELTEQPIEEDRKMIHKVNIRDRWGEYFAEAYRKAKMALRERNDA